MKDKNIEKVIQEVKDMKEKFLKEEQERNDFEWAGEGYKLLDDSEINSMIADFGYGDTPFHTADIWRLIKELMFWQTKYRLLRLREEESKK